jgi:hypothetical protein
VVKSGFFLRGPICDQTSVRKKADVVEAPQDLDHVGLLTNGPPELAGLPFIKSSDEYVLVTCQSRLSIRTGLVRRLHCCARGRNSK